jgi:hypothetical protein
MAKVTSILLLVTLKKLRKNGQKRLLHGNLIGNIHSVTGRPVTNRKKQKMTTLKIDYKPNGRNTETYRHVRVVGYYGSNDYKNLGMTVIVPERAYGKDKGFRRFDYMGIKSLEVEESS